MCVSAGVWGPGLIHTQGVLALKIIKRFAVMSLVVLILVSSFLPIQAKAAIGPGMTELLNLFTAMWNAWNITVQYNSGSPTLWQPVSEWQQTKLQLFLQHIGESFDSWADGILMKPLKNGSIYLNPEGLQKAVEFANWLVDEEGWNNNETYGFINRTGYFFEDGTPFELASVSRGVLLSGSVFLDGESYVLSNGTLISSRWQDSTRLIVIINGHSSITLSMNGGGVGTVSSNPAFAIGSSNMTIYNDTLFYGNYRNGSNDSYWSGRGSSSGSIYSYFGSPSTLAVQVATGVIGVPADDSLDPAIGTVIDVGAGMYSDTAGILDTVISGIQAGDLSVTMTPSTAAEVEDDVLPDYGTGADYEVLGLEDVFPFCLPFDLRDFVTLLLAEPETPSWSVPMQFGDIASYTWEFDLHEFDGIAENLRKFELLAFIVTLLFITRDIIRG